MAFPGTGVTGERQARALLLEGFCVTAWNRERAKAERPVPDGAITMLVDRSAVHPRIANAVVVDMNSMRPDGAFRMMGVYTAVLSPLTLTGVFLSTEMRARNLNEFDDAI